MLSHPDSGHEESPLKRSSHRQSSERAKSLLSQQYTARSLPVFCDLDEGQLEFSRKRQTRIASSSDEAGDDDEGGEDQSLIDDIGESHSEGMDESHMESGQESGQEMLSSEGNLYRLGRVRDHSRRRSSRTSSRTSSRNSNNRRRSSRRGLVQYVQVVDRGSQLSRTPVRRLRDREKHQRPSGSNNGMVGWSDVDLEHLDPSDPQKRENESQVVSEELSFAKIAGLDEYLVELREMVVLPLVCPQVFQKLGIVPPRGVLFHGPPGTGKTLVARVLASTCSKLAGRPVAFFHRNGSECLSKWVGEAEQNLAKLFREARQSAPSIIFFDELDGLAPDRSTAAGRDQTHVSLVSTLLSLMDGLEGRGEVVVVGATNRPDAIDPALRRPGRFDKEFYFGLPDAPARQSILHICDPKISPSLAEGLAAETEGCSGADLRGICTEAALIALRRSCPQLYQMEGAVDTNLDLNVSIQDADYWRALEARPAVARSEPALPKPLASLLDPLLTHLAINIQSSNDQVMESNKNKLIRNPIVCIACQDEELDVDLAPGDYNRMKRRLLLALARRLVPSPSQVVCLEGAGLMREAQGMASPDAALFTRFRPEALAGRVLVCPDLDRIAAFVSAEALACFLDSWAMTDSARLLLPLPHSLDLDSTLHDLHALNFDLIPADHRQAFLHLRFPPPTMDVDLADIVGVAQPQHDLYDSDWLSSFPRATFLYYNRPPTTAIVH